MVAKQATQFSCELLDFPHSGSNDANLPLVSRKTQVDFSRTKPLVVEFDKCYVPHAASSSLFHAFFFHPSSPTRTNLVLYVFQVTTSHTHNAAASCFTTVNAIVEEAKKQTGRDVDVTYVLMVPWQGEKATVTWNVAEEYSEARGEVVVQFLDLGRSSSDV